MMPEKLPPFLQDEAQRLRVSWRKSLNYFNSFATQWFAIKQAFDSGQYDNLRSQLIYESGATTFNAWAMEIGLDPVFITNMLKLHELALSAEDRRENERELAQQRKRRREAVATARAAREAAAAAQREARELVKEQTKENQKQSQPRVTGGAPRAHTPGRNRPTEQAKWQAKNDQHAYVTTHGAPAVIEALDSNGLTLDQAYGIVKDHEDAPSKQIAVLRELRSLAGGRTLINLAARALAALVKQKNSVKDWVAATIEIATVLAAARERIGSDNAFNEWLERNKIKVNKDDRAAYIKMGQNPEKTRDVLAATERHSVKWIYRYELKPRLEAQESADGFATVAKPEAESQIIIH
jgi:hypothetical protein